MGQSTRVLSIMNAANSSSRSANDLLGGGAASKPCESNQSFTHFCLNALLSARRFGLRRQLPIASLAFGPSSSNINICALLSASTEESDGFADHTAPIVVAAIEALVLRTLGCVTADLHLPTLRPFMGPIRQKTRRDKDSHCPRGHPVAFVEAHPSIMPRVRSSSRSRRRACEAGSPHSSPSTRR